MSSTFAWNMCGFNKPNKQRAICYWLQVAKLSFGCLLETKVHRENFQSVFDATFPGWSYLHNYDYHPLGRIWVCWSIGVEIVPALISATDRKDLWREMEFVATSCVRNEYLWIV